VEKRISIGSYNLESGLRLEWVHGFEIDVEIHLGEVVIKANKAGLTSLAQHLLTLAENDVPIGTHVHLDASRELEEGSLDLIIERSG
jgi:hypothetical protein